MSPGSNASQSGLDPAFPEIRATSSNTSDSDDAANGAGFAVICSAMTAAAQSHGTVVTASVTRCWRVGRTPSTSASSRAMVANISGLSSPVHRGTTER